MSELFNMGTSCDHADFIKKGTKICGRCGANIQSLVDQSKTAEALAGAPQTEEGYLIPQRKTEEFKNFVRQVLLDGNELSDVLDALLDGAADMGIHEPDAVKLIEDIKQEREQNTLLELKLSYDLNSARAGVANGNTVLAFRIENASKKNIQKLSISICHPETKHRIHFKPVTGLLRGMRKTAEVDLSLALVGFHSIRDGVLTAQSLTGAVEDYAIASEIRIYAENSEASRANISSQSFTTNMGGVISADGTSPISSKKTENSVIWEPVKLVRLTNIQESFEQETTIEVTPELPLKNQSSTIQSTIQLEESILPTPNARELSDGPLEDIAVIDSINVENQETAQNKEKLEYHTNEVEVEELISPPISSLDLGPPLRTMLADDFSSLEKAKTTFEEIIADFVRLLQLVAQTDPKNMDVVWLRQQLDYFDLRRISLALAVDPYEILGVLPDEVSGDGRKEPILSGGAIVIGTKGIYESSDLGSPTSTQFKTWALLLESGFSIKAMPALNGIDWAVRLTDGSNELMSFLISYAVDTEVRNELSTRLGKRFEQLLSTDEIIRNLEKKRLHEEYGIASAPAYPVAELTVDEYDNDQREEFSVPIHQANSQLIDVIAQFFKAYSVLSSLNETEASKTIFVFNRNDLLVSDFESSLAEKISPLLDNSDPVVIAIDKENQLFNEQGNLCGWSGLASVVNENGIYHVRSKDGNCFELDGVENHLSWGVFFSISSEIQQRDNVPDIWLGTSTHVLIKGSYFDFSNRISEWIVFHIEHRSELIRLFDQLCATLKEAGKT